MSEASEILLEMSRKKINGLAFSVKVQAIVIILLAFFMWRLETRVNTIGKTQEEAEALIND